MGAAKKLLDKKVLKDFVPLNALSAVHLEEISRKAIIETVRAGRYVLKAGDRDYQSVYLLEGNVELVEGGREVVGTVTSGTEAARHPLVHKQPRQHSVRALSSVTVARVDSSLLDVLLTWDESSGYDVVEIDAEDDGDWMTRMLQSQAFLQLPPSNIHQLLMRLEAINVRAGDVIVKQDEDGEYFYIVKSGRMAVSRKASSRSKEVLLAELGEGACFGEEALVSGTRRNATVTMLTDGSLMRLSKEDFDELLCAPLVHEVDYAEASQLAEKGAVWLDVRLPGEFSNQYIKGSRNLPLSALREQADTLDSDRKYIVCCDTGRRSASGAFILSQHGLDIYTLRNGLMDVPGEALNASPEASLVVDAPAREADILPFETDTVTDDVGSTVSGQDASDTESLDEQLQTAEAVRKEQQVEAEALRERVELLEGELSDSRAQQEALDQSLEKARQAGETATQDSDAAEKQRFQLESELARVREDYQQLGQRTSAVAGERDAANRELDEARSELKGLQVRLDNQQGEVGEQVSALRAQLSDRASELEDEVARRGKVETTLAETEKAAAEASNAKTRLLEQIDQLGQQVSEKENLLQENIQEEITSHEQQLKILQNANNDYEQKLEFLEQEKNALRQEIDTLQQSLDNAGGESDEIKSQLAESAEREEQLGCRISELEQQQVSREGDHNSELGSAREAMTRAQTELENLKREQQRLLNRQRKAEEALDRERHDHQNEVHRLHKEMKAAAGDSAEGLAAEMEALQTQVSESARLRDDLEIQLGERSAQVEETQSHADQLAQQLKLAQQGAREAEQQLLESNRLANEEMEICLNTEQGVQQGLRDALEASEKDCNSHQETITVINQELEELRDAYQQSKQALENNEGMAASQLVEIQAGLDAALAERDELLSSAEGLKSELDQLRAEAEVHRGLDGMLPDENSDLAEDEALQQARQNVEMAVRLRTQAEEQIETLNREIEQLKEQLHRASEVPVPVVVEGVIPSLDDSDPHASNPMLPDETEFENHDASSVAVLLGEEVAAPSSVTEPAPRSGLLKGMLTGLVIGAAMGAGLLWWQVDSGQISLLSAIAAKEAGNGTVVPVVAVKSPLAKQTPAIVTPKPVKQQTPVTQIDQSALDASNSAGDEKLPAPIVSKTLSNGMAAISSTSRTFPLARGMPDIPGRTMEPENTDRTSAEFQAVSRDPEPVKPAKKKVAEPVVEPVVVQPAGRFRDRLNNGDAGPAMVRFRADHYLMGSSDISPQFNERPQHNVRLRAFAIAANEVTFDDYDAFARATGRELPADNGGSRGKWPVVNISWEDARAYTQWLSVQTGARYRLPSEAEWEFVARSGTVTRYWWGEEAGTERANCFDCGGSDGGVQTSRVGSFTASLWGIYDMAGNAREWVQDCYVPNYSRAPADGRAVEVEACTRRVVRGGAYSSPSDQLRSTSRDQVDAGSRLDNLGFRVVREY